MAEATTSDKPKHTFARRHPAAELALVIVGTFVVGICFNTFLRPNNLTPGGLIGLSLLAGKWLHVEPAVTQLVWNVAMIGIVYALLGGAMATRSIVGSLALPLSIYLTKGLPAMTHDPLLAIICGGAGAGFGLGLVFLGNGSVGGFSAVSWVLYKYLGLHVDRTMPFMDGCVVLAAAFIFPRETVLCSLIGVVLVARTARSVLTGPDNSQLALIVSDRAEAIREHLLADLDLGCTVLQAEGGYSRDPRPVLMVVMRPMKAAPLKALVRSHDPAAFITLTQASEVLGYGFKPHF